MTLPVSLASRTGLLGLPMIAFLLLLLQAPGVMAQSAGVFAGTAYGLAGTTVEASVSFLPGLAPVSTLQFDLLYPSTLAFNASSAGHSALAAGKMVIGSSASGRTRILVFGLNQTAISSGAVARIRLNIMTGTPVGPLALRVSGIVASDVDGHPVSIAGVDGAVTVMAAADTTPPAITAVRHSEISGTSATIYWTTNELADSQVSFGTTTSYGGYASTATRRTLHWQRLTGLAPGTLYHYRVRSADAAGNLATSSDYSFATSSSGAAPLINSLNISDVTSKSATITWNTDEASDSVVEYWSANQDVRNAGLPDLATSHSVTLNGLQKLTEYQFIVRSSDSGGNQSASAEFSFTTTEGEPSLFALPLFDSASEQLGGEDTWTGIALTNTGFETATLRFTAMDGSGRMINGAGIVNPRDLILSPGSQMSLLEMDLFGEAFTSMDPGGWIKLESESSNIGGFYLTFDDARTFMDGANFGDVPMKHFAFTEIEPSGSTQINIANGSPNAATVTFHLVRSDGSIRSSATRFINGYGDYVADLFGDLFTGQLPDPTDYVLMRSTEGVRPFQLMQKRTGDFSSLTGQDVSAGGTSLYSPQYIVGDSWNTSFSVINLDARAGTVSLRFIRGEDGTQLGSTRSIVLPAYGKLYVDNSSFFLNLQNGAMAAGYLEIVSDGIRLTGSTVFGDAAGQTLSSALPLVYNLQDSVLYSHVASSDTYYTGIAILNPHQTDVFVAIHFHGADGHLLGQTTAIVPARQRQARVMTEYFPFLNGMDQYSGYVRLEASQPVVSFSLFGTHNQSVLSAIPQK